MLDTGMCFNVLCMMEIIMSTAYISNGNFKAFIIRVGFSDTEDVIRIRHTGMHKWAYIVLVKNLSESIQEKTFSPT